MGRSTWSGKASERSRMGVLESGICGSPGIGGKSWPRRGQSWVTLVKPWPSLGTCACSVTKGLGAHGFYLFWVWGPQEHITGTNC